MTEPEVDLIQLCRWVPAGDTFEPVLVSGVRRSGGVRQGRVRGPWRVLVDGVIRVYPCDLWTEVIE